MNFPRQRQYSMAAGFPGQLASYQDYTASKSTLDECINAAIGYLPFGNFVVGVPGVVGGLNVPTALGQVVVGLIPIQHNQTGVNGESGIPPMRPMSYAYKGVYFVTTETPINRGDDVYIRKVDSATPGAYDQRGLIRNDDDGGNAELLSANKDHYRVLDSVVAGEVTRIELDLPSTLLV